MLNITKELDKGHNLMDNMPTIGQSKIFKVVQANFMKCPLWSYLIVFLAKTDT